VSLWRYRDRLPVEPLVTLEEGDTPLVPAPWLSERTGCEVYLKVEGANPTGSFKDRGMTVAVSAAIAEGAQAVVCASTGNTAASAAAYAARAGLRGAVIVPEGKIATGKLAQALMHGARVVALPAAFTAVTGAAHWDTLVRARAIENQSFVVAADQVGAHPGGMESYGASQVVDPWGEVLARVEGGEGFAAADLDLTRQDEVRASLPSLANRVPAAYRWPLEAGA